MKQVFAAVYEGAGLSRVRVLTQSNRFSRYTYQQSGSFIINIQWVHIYTQYLLIIYIMFIFSIRVCIYDSRVFISKSGCINCALEI